jgi:IS30 family transposase
VASKLYREWSPEQIAGWLKRTYANDETHQVSHETIYRSLFIQARGALKKEPHVVFLLGCCPVCPEARMVPNAETECK